MAWWCLGTFSRSATGLGRRFGEDPVVSMGILQAAVAVFSLPFVASQIVLLGHVLLGDGRPPGWLEEPVVLASIVGPLWVGVVVGSALAAVGKTALYAAIREDRERAPLVDVPVEELVEVVDGADQPAEQEWRESTRATSAGARDE